MKKQLLIAIAVLMLLVISGCGSSNTESNEESPKKAPVEEAQREKETSIEKVLPQEEIPAEETPQRNENNEVNEISLEEARNIALKDANLTNDQVHYLKEHPDYDDGISVYDIEFYYDNKEYDYEIDAKTGMILEKDSDIEHYEIPQKEKSPSSDYITAEKAKEIALKKAGLSENDVIYEKAERDEDDGRIVYEIDFHSGNIEYDFEIDAVTGEILDYDKDYDD